MLLDKATTSELICVITCLVISAKSPLSPPPLSWLIHICSDDGAISGYRILLAAWSSMILLEPRAGLYYSDFNVRKPRHRSGR